MRVPEKERSAIQSRRGKVTVLKDQDSDEKQISDLDARSSWLFM